MGALWAPQRVTEVEFVDLSLKIWQLVATILMIFADSQLAKFRAASYCRRVLDFLKVAL